MIQWSLSRQAICRKGPLRGRTRYMSIVADVDAVLSKALAFGAELVADIEDKPYDERQAGIRDVAGNTWWISTFKKAAAG